MVGMKVNIGDNSNIKDVGVVPCSEDLRIDICMEAFGSASIEALGVDANMKVAGEDFSIGEE